MIKKCVLTVLTTSINEDEVKVAINDFVHYKHSNYKVTTNDTGNNYGGAMIITFATTFEASFIKERLLDLNFPYHFLVYVMENDDDFDYSFGNVIIDDLEDVNPGLYFVRVDDFFTKHDYFSSNLKFEDIFPKDQFTITSTSTMDNGMERIVYDYKGTNTGELSKDMSTEELKNKFTLDTKEYTLDELIDIIQEVGIENLTARQKQCLKKYND